MLLPAAAGVGGSGNGIAAASKAADMTAVSTTRYSKDIAAVKP